MPTVLKSGSLNLLEPSWPLQACNGIALPFYLFTFYVPIYIYIYIYTHIYIYTYTYTYSNFSSIPRMISESNTVEHSWISCQSTQGRPCFSYGYKRNYPLRVYVILVICIKWVKPCQSVVYVRQDICHCCDILRTRSRRTFPTANTEWSNHDFPLQISRPAHINQSSHPCHLKTNIICCVFNHVGCFIRKLSITPCAPQADHNKIVVLCQKMSDASDMHH